MLLSVWSPYVCPPCHHGRDTGEDVRMWGRGKNRVAWESKGTLHVSETEFELAERWSRRSGKCHGGDEEMPWQRAGCSCGWKPGGKDIPEQRASRTCTGWFMLTVYLLPSMTLQSAGGPHLLGATLCVMQLCGKKQRHSRISFR